MEPSSQELYVGPTPSEAAFQLETNDRTENLNVILQEDSQTEEVKQFIDASLI